MNTLARFYQDHATTMRIAMGQCSVLITLLLLAAFFGLIPDRDRAVIEGRASLAEAIASNSSIFITRADLRRMEANLRLVLSRNPDILSAAVRHADEGAVVTVGEHTDHWLVEGDPNTQLVVPIWEGEKRWGQMEMRFTPIAPTGPLGFFLQPVNLLIGFIAIASFFAFFLYLRKMLKDLDPSQAIPDRVRSALDTMAEGLLVLDAKQNIVLANEAFSSIVGVSAGKLLGQKASSFTWFNMDDSPMERADFPWSRALKESLPQRNEPVRLLIGDDHSRTFQTNCSPVLTNENKAGGVLISFDDITELEEKEKQLIQSKQEAEQANQAKSDFLANMSHEIRTPMTAIMGFTEVLKREYSKRGSSGVDADNLRYLNTIGSSSQHLLDLINDILDLSKVEAGRVEVEQVLCSVHWIIQDVIQVMRERAEEKGLTLEYVPNGPLPETIQSDPARLRQILINLIGNAIKFTERGSVEVTTCLVEGGTEPMMSIGVIDSGIGMTSTQTQSVFSAFVQADSSITRRFGGTGLGLSICKRFAEALGGGVAVSSEAGKGSVFTVTIPAGQIKGATLLSPEQLTAHGQSLKPRENGRWVFQSADVLVVDDSLENRELLTLVLEGLGLNITTACDGAEALDALARRSFELVVMDVSMPVMDGYTAVGKMREQGLTLPVIALTAHAMIGSEERCVEAGYSGYLSKPINFDQLAERLALDLECSFVDDEAEPAPRELIEAVNSHSGASYDQRSSAGVFGENIDTPILSSLASSGDRYQSIILRFVDRLQQQILAIEQALQKQDFARLEDLGHWLKGSAGSVGFHDFDEPGQELEAGAIRKDKAALDRVVPIISQLGERVAAAYQAGAAVEPAAQVSSRAGGDTELAALPEVVKSSMMADARFKPLIEKYVRRLPAQLNRLDQALDSKDLDAVADWAHWLLGSAGTLGLNEFTEPATRLQVVARTGQYESINIQVRIIKTLIERIELTEAGEIA